VIQETMARVTSALGAASVGAIFFAASANSAGSLQQRLDIFEAACFPSLDTLEVLKKRVVAIGWKVAPLGTHPMLDQAIGNFLTPPDAVIQTISVDSFMLQDKDETYFLVYRKSQANDETKQAINSCHIYDFAAKADLNADEFEVWKLNVLLKYKYLNVRGAYYLSESEPSKRPRDGKLLTGLHLIASNFAQ
jgi:hypothetical protein